MTKPSPDDIEEFAAVGLLLAKSLVDGNERDAATFTATMCILAKGLEGLPMPDWMRDARPRIALKLMAYQTGIHATA